MRFQLNPGEKLRSSASAGIGALEGATSVILKTFIKSGYSAYLRGRKTLTNAKETVEEVTAEARAEIEAENGVLQPKGTEGEPSPRRDAEQQKASHSGLKPGTAAPVSGHYQEVGPRGGKGREIDSERGEPLPPTTRKGRTYTLVEEGDDRS